MGSKIRFQNTCEKVASDIQNWFELKILMGHFCWVTLYSINGTESSSHNSRDPMAHATECTNILVMHSSWVQKHGWLRVFFIANYSQSSSLQSLLSSCLLPDCSCCSNSSLDLTGGNRGRDSGGFYAHVNIRTEAKEIDLSVLQKCSPFTGEGFTSTPESVSTAASLPSVDEARLPGKN